MLLTLSALFGWLNHKYLPLPHTVGLLVMSVAASVVMVAIDLAFPDRHLFESLTSTLLQIDFSKVVMDGMLAFLLFAGSLHIDVATLRSRAIPVALLALLGTVISTGVVGLATWWVARTLGLPISLAWALVFGALISPTDPVAVLSTLRNVAIPAELEVELQGESLFNDGVGIVLFTILLRFATGGGAEETSASAIFQLLVVEGVGGIVLGLATGYLAYWGMRLIDDYPVEVLISLALVTGTYAVAQRLHVSGPLAMVAAGLLIGDRGPRYAMSNRTQTYLFGLWTVIDEVLNSVLFLLIGLEVLVLSLERASLTLALAAIPIVLVARLLAVAAPLPLFIRSGILSLRNVPFLTWAGVRGGISVALALSLPASEARLAILSATYGVVLFSIVVQGLTLGWVARRTTPAF
jgi:monovalent cation:H+ antiporter, CPA1 family